MSKYTTEVRFICETLAGFDTSQSYGKVSDILDASWDKVFDFDFPIFDEDYRSVLCKKILKHYYTREIGLETVGLWKLKLDTKMNEIMPLFNKRYESASFKFNPLWDVDYTRTTNGDENGSNNRELNGINRNKESIDKTYEKAISEIGEDKIIRDIIVNGSNSGSEIGNSKNNETDRKTGTETFDTERDGSDNTVDRYSDTPQGGLTGIRNDTYLTKAELIDKTSHNEGIDTTTYNVTESKNSDAESGMSYDNSAKENTNENNVRNTDKNSSENNKESGNVTNDGSRNENESTKFSTTKDYIEHIAGKMGGGSYAKAIMEYRDSLINVDMEIIDELGELFMKLW